MTRLILLTFSWLFLLADGLQANCPGCATSLPDSLPADTIFLSSAPDGQVGEYYEGDLSFRMPMTTTPVNANDPDTPAGLNISEINISSVTNVPPGLSWEANQTTFDVSEETDGCVRFCGTPLIPGTYEVEVIISAQVLFVNQTSSFSFPIQILPGETVAEGFTLENNAGCGEVLASFTNNVPSGGQEGFRYEWDFGNGNSSTMEHPAPQLYETPGEYEIEYRAIVDTFGYLLQKVTITEASCDDFLGNAPDLLLEIYNPLGEKIYFTDEVQNASLPLVFEPQIFIEDGPYEIRLVDDDQGLGGGDDLCGSFGFVKTSNGLLEDNGSALEIDVLHPVDTIRSEGSVIVFPQPDPPSLESDLPEPLCEGDTISLRTDYEANTQWYQDTMPLLNENSSKLIVTESGRYWVTYTNASGCSAASDSLEVAFGSVPAAPVFENDNNLLTLFDPEALPDSFQLQWFFNGEVLPGEQDTAYCIPKSGSYSLEVTDLATGCSSFYNQSVSYNDDFPGCMPISSTESAALAGLKVFPTLLDGGPLTVEGNVYAGRLQLMLFNAQGQVIWKREQPVSGGFFRTDIPTAGLAKGVYVLRASDGYHLASFRLLKP